MMKLISNLQLPVVNWLQSNVANSTPCGLVANIRADTKKVKNPFDFLQFFCRFSIYLAPSGAKYCEKGWGRYKNWRGMIDKPILELLTFGSNPDFSSFGSKLTHFGDFLTGDTPLPTPPTHFWTLQYRNNVSLRMANRYTRIFDAG